MKFASFVIFREKTANRLMVVVNLAFLILLALSAADLTWKIRAAWRPALPVTAVVVPKPVVKKAELPGAAAMLFGTAAGQPAPVVQKLPPTSLALVLRGTVVPSNGVAYAIVAAKKGDEEQVVSVGDRISGGAVVERVLPDRIEIIRNGRHEVLEVEGDDNTVAAVVNDQSWRVSAGYRRKWMKNLPALGQKVRAQPVKDKQGRVGFRLLSKDKELLKTVGLESGDIVYEINGISLSNPAQALKAAGELMKSKEVSVRFGRNGQVRTRVYRMED